MTRNLPVGRMDVQISLKLKYDHPFILVIYDFDVKALSPERV